MRIKVEFYEALRVLTQRHEWLAEVSEKCTAREVFALAQTTFPALASYCPQPIVMAGLDHVPMDHTLREGETLSFLPAAALQE